MTPAAEITGKEIEYGATSKENAENIVRFFESIGGKVERDGFGVVELTRKGAKATVQHGMAQQSKSQQRQFRRLSNTVSKSGS